MFFQLFLAILWIIFYTAAPAAEPRFGAGFTALVLVAGFLFCAVGGRLYFHHLVRRASDLTVTSRGAFLEKALTNHGIMVLAVFSFYFFSTDAKFFLDSLSAPCPTLGALAFFIFFMAHLNAAILPDAYAESGPTEAGGQFLLRRPPGLFPMTWLAFAPWFLLSGTSDLLGLISWEPFQKLWQTPFGQTAYLVAAFLMVAIFGPALVIRFWGSRPLPESPLRDFMNALCKRMDLDFRGILTWPILNHMPTAAVMGIWGRFRYILVTEALMAIATPGELAAVLAHETGHVKRRHVWYYFTAVAGFSVLAFGMETITNWAALAFFGRFPVFYTEYFSQASIGALQAFSQAAFFVLFFRFVFGYFMRNFEREADLFVFETPADPADLVSCLEKIARYSGKPIDAKSWHHFGIKERMDYVLLAMEDARWIARHAAKVKRSVIAAGAALAIFCPISLGLATGRLGGDMDEKLATGVFEALLALPAPHQGKASLDLADYLQANGDFERARLEYERVLAEDGENSRAINNLAWMLATCPDQESCDPEAALMLARRAALLSPEPHILDTLAEALLRNGFFEEAIRTEKRAYEEAKDNREYFKAQIERFQEAQKKAETEGMSEKSFQ